MPHVSSSVKWEGWREMVSQVPSCSEKFPQILSRLQLPSGPLHVDVCHSLELHVPNWTHRLTSHISFSISVKDNVHSPNHLDLESSQISLHCYLISNQSPSLIDILSWCPFPSSQTCQLHNPDFALHFPPCYLLTPPLSHLQTQILPENMSCTSLPPYQPQS